MRIFEITTVHPFDDVRILKKYVYSLIEEGHEVVYCSRGNRIQNNIEFTHYKVRDYRNRLFRIIFGNIRVGRLCLLENCELYHFHDPELLPIMLIMRYVFRKPILFDMHEDIMAQLYSKTWIPTIFRSPVIKVTDSILKLVLVKTPTIYAEKSYKTRYSYIKRTEIVLNMPNLEALENVKSIDLPSGLNLGYLGRVTVDRGIDHMLNIIRRLRRHGIRVYFHCIGELDPGLDIQVHGDDIFYGRLDSDEGYRIIKGCNFAFCLLKPIPNYYDSYPTKLFEYMALGVYPLISDFPLWQDVINFGEFGFAADPRCYNEFVDCIVKKHIYNDDYRVAEEVLRQYSWRYEFSKFLHFAESILQKN